jgi:ubiquinone/menaquinone biosynthesis C-methylase UbiE
MSQNTKQAEKDYLARTGSSAWEYAKPFSHEGADTLSDSAQILHDFSVAMLALQPSPDDLILDVGAGGCWCSDLLGRLNRRSVAVDISTDMLRTGRSRPTGAAFRAVAGDLERLPFQSRAFNKAVCFSAIHHVPDIPKAVGEIGRVLTDDGVAFFSEPGRGHAAAAVATAAMRDFGVLEQDILVGDFTRACHAAGFRDVRLKVLSYAIPAFDLTPEQWDAWSRLAVSKRPIRAAGKMMRAVAEFFGAGKRGALFREDLGISVVRTLRHAMENHPVIVASKTEGGAATHQSLTWSATLDVRIAESAPRSGHLRTHVTATNTGTERWKAASRSGTGHVTLGVQVLDAEHRLVTRDHHRVGLPHDVAPGQTVTLSFDCPMPDSGGNWALKFDLVAEGVTWFDAVGSTPVVCDLRLT